MRKTRTWGRASHCPHYPNFGSHPTSLVGHGWKRRWTFLSLASLLLTFLSFFTSSGLTASASRRGDVFTCMWSTCRSVGACEGYYIHASIAIAHCPYHSEEQMNLPLRVFELQLETEGSQLAGEWPSEGGEGVCNFILWVFIDTIVYCTTVGGLQLSAVLKIMFPYYVLYTYSNIYKHCIVKFIIHYIVHIRI